jgi:hypothetical protein
MKKSIMIISLMLLITLVGGVTSSFAQFGSVQGVILKAPYQQPIPGLTVSLVHPVLGRSALSFTDALGRFAIMGIPLRPEPYYLEVYWGGSLIYRMPVQVGGPVGLPPIIL